MKKILVVIPHSHTWFWTETCLASLLRNPPRAEGYDVSVVIVDNSPWSPAYLGARFFTQDSLDWYILDNYKSNKFHASALDCVVETHAGFDYLMAWETDVLACRPDWLQWFLDQMKPTDYAVGAWHHEQFVNPSCTLYRGSVLRDMLKWCRAHPDPDVLRWGPLFGRSSPLDANLPARLAGLDVDGPAAQAIIGEVNQYRDWIAGPFAEKRGWPAGTVLKEKPSGQEKGPGWYEPGQQLHHWAVKASYTYTVCPTLTTNVNNVPVQTLYGATMPDPDRQLEAVELFGNCYAAHMWGGTRALDILKHPVTCDFVKHNTPIWLAREARYWKHVVPPDIQLKTLELIRTYGWHLKGQGTDHVTDRDREAAEYVRTCYRAGGVEW